MEDDLDQEDDQEQHEAPASFGVVVLEDAGDPPLPVHAGVGHHAVLGVLDRASSCDVCHRVIMSLMRQRHL